MVGFSLDLLGHPITTHFGTPTSIPVHLQYLSILSSCVCIASSLLVMAARSSAKAAEFMVICDVPKVYPLLPLSSHLSNGSKNNNK